MSIPSDRPHGPLNRDLVLPPARRLAEQGHIDEALNKAYDEGLRYGYEAGVQSILLEQEPS